MKKLIVTACVAALAMNANAGGAPSKAAKRSSSVAPFENFYGVVTGGYSKSMKVKGDFGGEDMGDSAIMGLGVKTDVCKDMKVGLNFEYRPSYKINETTSSDVTKDKYKIGSLMLTGSYDISALKTFFTPYIEVGAGAARINSPSGSYSIVGGSTNSTDSKTKTNFAYSAGLGAKFELDKNFNLGVGYKYSNFGKFENSVTISGTKYPMNAKRLHTNDFIASLEYKF
ncbi:MAG: outer membrane beta-barrel protein [Rickettsiales bacterium]